MKSLSKYFQTTLSALLISLSSFTVGSMALADDIVRSPQISRDGLFWVAPHTKACAVKSLSLTNQLLPDIGLDNSMACNNPAQTYLHSKTVISADGQRTETREIKELKTTFTETREFHPDGAPQKLTVKVTTTGPIMDTSKGTRSRFVISDIIPDFGGESARALSETVSFGPSGMMRSQQAPISAPDE